MKKKGALSRGWIFFGNGVLATTIRIITKASRRTRPRKAAAPTTIAGN